MLLDCDFIRDKQDNFYIVKGYWNDNGILANLVFVPCKDGDRYNAKLNILYRKVIDENIIAVSLNMSDVVETYKPQEKFTQLYKNLLKPWKGLADCLIRFAGFENVGIFGSYLLGFELVKDVDFVVYGKSNCHKIKNNITNIQKEVNGGEITDEHIQYQIKKHAKYFSKFSNFEKLLKNKWSSIQLAPGVLSTIRFVYFENEIPENPFSSHVKKQIVVHGMVVSDFGCNFVPRTFKIRSKGKIYTIATNFWIYQSCVKVKDFVTVKGNLHSDGNTISLTEFSHGIRLE